MTDTIKCPKRGGIECETSIACADGCLYDNDPIHPNRIGDRTAPAKEASAEPLKPCPFCGDRLRIAAHTRKNHTTFHRLFCDAETDCFFMDFSTEEEAIEMGSRRSSPVREDMGLATPKTAAHPSRPATKKRDLWQVMQDLYDSEINCGCQSFWDGGFRVWLGDDLNGREAEGDGLFLDEHFNEAGDWLHESAMRLYSTSDYAKRNT